MKPNRWISGTDPLHHRMYVAFGYHRVSSRLRGEQWDLDWETWRDIWLPNWKSRGRDAHDLCMARIDFEKPWCRSNVHLVTRRRHSQRVREYYR